MERWTPNPEFYDIGRPFPGEQVAALFRRIGEQRGDEQLTVFEPGCGTGRVLVPLAACFPNWHFTGVDSCAGALHACRSRCAAEGLSNVRVREGRVEELAGGDSVDLIIHSSVLHAVPHWQHVMSSLTSMLADRGVFCLVGDYGDLYDEALGRTPGAGVDPALSVFWRCYLKHRLAAGAADTEASQVGCRWDLRSCDLALWLEEHGFVETSVEATEWTQTFSGQSLLRIVEERCYSSMFSVPDEIYDKIAAAMRAELPRLALPPIIRSRHRALARFYRRSPGNTPADSVV